MNNKKNVISSGTASANYLQESLNELYTYRTPKSVIEYLKSENIKIIIGNPPFEISNHSK